VLEHGDGRGDPVVGEIRRDRDHRKARHARRVLRDVEGAPATDPDDGVVRAGPEGVGELERGGKRSAVNVMDLRVLEHRAERGRDLLALSRSHDSRDIAAGRDPAVAQERSERGDRSASNLDRERRGDHPC
jgi:hypothetical protein